MAPDGASAVVSTEGYLSRRSALELAILDSIAVATLLMAVVPGVVRLDAARVGMLLGFLPALVFLTRSMTTALAAPGARSFAELRPDHVLRPSRRLDQARALTRRGLTLAAVPGVVAALAVGAGALLP